LIYGYHSIIVYILLGEIVNFCAVFTNKCSLKFEINNIYIIRRNDKMKSTNIYAIHGYTSSNQADWFPWLKEQFKNSPLYANQTNRYI